jgi:RNA polymerase sigma factor (sigma-70 family)
MDLPEFKIQVFPLKNKLFRLAKRLLEDHEDAQDVVQEVFIKLWNQRGKLDEYRSVEALAVVMTRNMCLDKLKAKKYPVENLENIQAEIQDFSSEPPADLSEVVSRIREIIRTLPEQQKTIMQLRDIEGYDFEEIAGMLNMNENAVRVNLSRARKRVRDILISQKLYEYQRN